MASKRNTKECPFCGTIAHFDEPVEIQDDEGKHAPCHACLPLDRLFMRIDAFFDEILNRDLTMTGMGDMEEYKDAFYHNDACLCCLCDGAFQALFELYGVYDSHELLLIKPPYAVRGLEELEVKNLQRFAFSELLGYLEDANKEDTGVIALMGKVRQSLEENPSFKVYGDSPSGKKEAPYFDGLGAIEEAGSVLEEAKKTLKEASSWGERLCQRDGFSSRGEDGELLLAKLSRCITALTYFNWALNLTVCPSHPSLLRKRICVRDEILARAVKRAVFFEKEEED